MTFSFDGIIKPQNPFDQNYSDLEIEEIKVDKQTIYLNKDLISYFPTIDKEGKKVAELSRSFTILIDIFNDCVGIIGGHRDMIETTIDQTAGAGLNPHTFKKYLYKLYLNKKDYRKFEKIDKIFSDPPLIMVTFLFQKMMTKNLTLRSNKIILGSYKTFWIWSIASALHYNFNSL